MEGLSHQLLASARLPIDQYRGVQLGGGADAPLEILHLRGLGHDASQGGQAAPAATPDNALAHHIEAGAVHRSLHLTVHHDGDGGGVQLHLLSPAVHQLLPLVVDGLSRPQGPQDGAAVFIQAGIELANVVTHRLLLFPIIVHGDAVIPNDAVLIHNEDSVRVLAHPDDRPDLLQIAFRHAASPSHAPAMI